MSLITEIIASALKGKTTIEKEEIALQMGIGEKTLRNIIKGDSKVGIDELEKLSEILKKDLIWQYYTKSGRDLPNTANDPEADYVITKKEITVSICIRGEAKAFQDFETFLGELKLLSRQYELSII